MATSPTSVTVLSDALLAAPSPDSAEFGRAPVYGGGTTGPRALVALEGGAGFPYANSLTPPPLYRRPITIVTPRVRWGGL